MIEVVVEIGKGGRNKYEWDAKRGVFVLDRVLYSSVHYPTDYGFIVGTRAADGEPLDVLIVVEEPTFPGCRVRIRPIGVLTMKDEKGMDEKILAVSARDPRYLEIHDLKDLSPHRLLEIEHFFAVYKTLEDKRTNIIGWRQATEAKKLVLKSHENYKKEEHLRRRK